MGRIDTELHIIQNNRYGEDVRMAIHDALDKLEKTSGGGVTAARTKLRVKAANGFISVCDSEEE